MKFWGPWAIFAFTGIFLIDTGAYAAMVAWALLFFAWLFIYHN